MELLAKFDLVMKQHIEVVESGHSSYLGNIIQNEPIASINRKMLDTMVIEMKQSKYYSIIWDCTPDVQSKSRWTVKMNKAQEIKEHFIFLVASETEQEQEPFQFFKPREGDHDP